MYSHGHVGMVKSGEAEAANSARRSVDLVLQQIHVPLSTSTHDLVQAEGDLRDLKRSPSTGNSHSQFSK